MIDLKPYIHLTTMMVLATKDENGNPYTANVYFRVDEKYNFYFISNLRREHSHHIEKDAHVAWSIINTEQYQAKDKDKKWLQFQGIAKLLDESESTEIYKKLYNPDKPYSEILEKGHRIFECIPTRVKIWDETLYGWAGKIINF